MTITLRSLRPIENTFLSRKQEIVSKTTSGIPRFYYVRTQSFSVSHGENIIVIGRYAENFITNQTNKFIKSFLTQHLYDKDS
jgi:phage antirepressor YoqD-like protein